MNSDSCRIDSITAVSVTSASKPKAWALVIRLHCECAAKNVEKRIAIAAPSIAFARSGYLRAAFRSQTTSSAIDTRMPMTTRTGG